MQTTNVEEIPEYKTGSEKYKDRLDGGLGTLDQANGEGLTKSGKGALSPLKSKNAQKKAS